MAFSSPSSRSLDDKQVGSQSLVSELPDIGKPPGKGLRFWLIFLALCVSLFLSALELTAVSTALPTIIQELKGDDFVWVGSAYALAATALLPASGALAELFGRRIAMLASLGLFALGSALCGAAQNMSWLIAARTIQGAGGGGIQSVSSIIVSDLVPLRERGVYNSFIGLTWGIAAAIGPLIGGALAKEGQWRWLFYLNLPISGLSAILVLVFLKLRMPPGTFKEKFARMDWIGNAIIISSSSAVAIGLTWGGVQFAWTSPRVLVPLILGLCGIVFFLFYEAKFASHPMVPYRLLSNRTSLSGYIQTFILPILAIAITYYLPTYYQACRGASPVRAGVLCLSMTLMLAPSLIICGASITITKAYRPQLFLGWCFLLVAMGVLSTVHADSPLSHPLGFSTLVNFGCGILYAGTYFPVLAPLNVRDNAYALAFFAYCRSFAAVWGVTVGGAVLQNQLHKRLPAAFLSQLPQGVALAYSAIPAISSLEEPVRGEVREAFAKSIAVIWEVMIGVGGVGLLSAFLMKALPLHTEIDERWGIEGNAANERRGSAMTDEMPMRAVSESQSTRAANETLTESPAATPPASPQAETAGVA